MAFVVPAGRFGGASPTALGAGPRLFNWPLGLPRSIVSVGPAVIVPQYPHRLALVSSGVHFAAAACTRTTYVGIGPGPNRLAPRAATGQELAPTSNHTRSQGLFPASAHELLAQSDRGRAHGLSIPAGLTLRAAPERPVTGAAARPAAASTATADPAAARRPAQTPSANRGWRRTRSTARALRSATTARPAVPESRIPRPPA